MHRTISRIRATLMMTVATGMSGCLGADTVYTDEGRFPRLQLNQSVYLLDLPRSTQRVINLDVLKHNYNDIVRFHADTVPPGFEVTVTPEFIRGGSPGAGTSLIIRVTESAASGSHRIVVRASGVVVRSTRTSFTVRVP